MLTLMRKSVLGVVAHQRETHKETGKGKKKRMRVRGRETLMTFQSLVPDTSDASCTLNLIRFVYMSQRIPYFA